MRCPSWGSLWYETAHSAMATGGLAQHLCLCRIAGLVEKRIARYGDGRAISVGILAVVSNRNPPIPP